MALDSKSGSRKINQNVDLAPGARDLTTTGNITAGAFYGDGSNLTGVSTASANDALITITAGGGLTGGGGFTVDQAADATITVSHSDTSAQDSVANTVFNVIQSITLDTYGHITAIESKDIGTAGFYVKTTGETGVGQKIGLGSLTYQTVQFFAGTGLSVVRTDNEIQFSAPNAANWDTAYTYSQVGHLPLAGGTLTGGLIITGDLSGATDIYVDDQIISTGDNNTYMQFSAADTWRVVTGGSQRLKIDTSSVSISNANLTVSGTISATDGTSTQWNTAYSWGDHSLAGYLTSYTESDTLATVTSRGNTTTDSITITNDTGLIIRTSTNGTGAKINFSDHQSGSYTQNGTITYIHSDTASYGSGNAFIISGTESSMTILADGKLMYNEGIYSKPATGTGAGTRKDANWDTAYSWGNHAGLYLPINGKADDSELIDGFDSTELYRRVYSDYYTASPTSRWYVITLPYASTSGWSDYFYFDVLAHRDIANLQSQLHYRVYLHNRGISANNNQLNASVVTELEQLLEFAEFGYKSGVASSSQFFIKLGEDYSGISIVAYPGENTITASMIASVDTAPTGFTAVTPTKYAKDTIDLDDVTSNGSTTSNNITTSGTLTLNGQVNLNSTVRLNPNGTNFEIDTDTTERVVFAFNVNGTRNWSLRHDADLNFYKESGSGNVQINGNRILTTLDSTDFAPASHTHTSENITGWYARDTTNIDTFDPDGNWTTAISNITTVGTKPSSYVNVHNLGGNGVDFQTQIATYYGNNNRTWIRSRYDGTNTWVAWTELITADNIGSASVASAANADTLDNLDSTQFLRSDADDTASGIYTFTGKLKLTQTATTIGGTTVANASILIGDTTTGIGIDNNEIHSTGVLYVGTNTGNLVLRPAGSVVDASGNRFLTTADEGTGNGLDADTLDGNHASAFLQNSGTVTHSGLISFTGTGSTSGIRFNSETVANDAFGIRVNGTSNAGELEFYSTDDDTEPFVFRHYTTGQDGTGTSVEWARINNDFMSHQSDMRAPLFYDLNNTGYYIDPSGRSNFSQIAIQGTSYYFDRNTSYFRWQSPSGYIDIGSGNTTWAHFYTDRPGFYFGPSNVAFDGNISAYSGDETASFATYYDSNNTAYYVDPASTSYLNEISGPYFKHISVPSSRLGASYDERVILLIPKVETNNSYENRIHGKLIMGKTGGNVIDFFDIEIQSVYNDTTASFTSSGQRTGHKFVTCTYNGIKWVAIQFAYTANPYNYAYFTGHASTNFPSASPDMLRVISYYNTNGVGVLNTEIYNSITDYNPNPLYKKISNGNGGLTIEGPTYSDIFYDRQNTSYYVDPAVGSVLAGVSFRTDGTASNAPSVVSANIGVYADTYAFIDLATSNTNGSWIDFSKADGGDYGGRIRYNNGSNYMQFYANGAEQVRIFNTNAEALGSFRAPIFYDSNNTGYYGDFAGTSLFNVVRIGVNATQTFAQLNISNGIGGATLYRDIDLKGSWGSGEGHAITATHGTTSTSIVGQMVFQHDSPGSRIKWGRLYHSGDQSTYPMHLISSGSSAYLEMNTGDMRAPIFYDYNNTGYYVDPASASIFDGLRLKGINNQASGSDYILWIDKQNNNDWGVVITGNLEYGFDAQMASSHTYAYRALKAGSEYFRVGSDLIYHDAQMRAPIFYDNNNTGYYVDPAGYSNMDSGDIGRSYNVGGDLYIGGDANTYYPVYWWGGTQQEILEVEIYRSYSETAPSTWNTATHKGGLNLKFTTNFGGWGGADYDITVTDFRQIYSNMVADLSFFGNQRGFVVWLRGGGASYHYKTRGSHNGTPTVSLTAVDPGNNGTGVTYRTDAPQAVLLSRYFIRAGNLYSYNNAVLHAGGDQVKSGYLQSDSSLRAPIFYDSNNTGYYVDPASTSNINAVNVSSITIGGGATIQESTDRADLIQITSNTSGWGGLQIRNSSNEGRWSFMTDGEAAGIYNDEDNFWHIYFTEVGATEIKHGDGNTKLATSTGGVSVTGTMTASGDVVAYSDASVKENIQTIDNALEKVVSMRGVSYNRTDIDDKSTKIGVIAQEIQKVLPEVVQEQEDGLLGVSYGNITAVLIEAIKEQQKQIEELKAIVDGLTK